MKGLLSWKIWVVGIIILCIVGGVSVLIENIPETLKAIGWGLFISSVVGYIAFNIICPKKKRGVIANRITAVVALLAYLASVLAAIFMPSREFSLKLFLLEGVLVGVITMSIIYGVAEAIHWAIKGKSMAWSELQDLGDKFQKDVFWFLRKRN